MDKPGSVRKPNLPGLEDRYFLDKPGSVRKPNLPGLEDRYFLDKPGSVRKPNLPGLEDRYFLDKPGSVGMQVANVKLRQILPRVGKIWVCTPQNRTYGVWRIATFWISPVRLGNRTYRAWRIANLV